LRVANQLFDGCNRVFQGLHFSNSLTIASSRDISTFIEVTEI